MHLGAVARLQHRAQLAQAVDQAELEHAAPRPELAGEKLALLALELAGAALAHPVLEAVVYLGLQPLQPRDIVPVLLAKRVEHRFLLAGGVDAALDAEAGDQVLE